MSYEYLLDKITKAKFCTFPFEHLYIQDFLSEEHFKEIYNDKQIHFPKCSSNQHLREVLGKNLYKVVNFPGCTTKEEVYYKYIEKLKNYSIQDNCNHWDEIGEVLEGFGITYQLKRYNNQKVFDLISFMNSNMFHTCLVDKFKINRNTSISTSVQKNLSNYEISPHPDVKEKALTYLLNINNVKNQIIKEDDFNTHLLSFKDEYKEIYDIWEKDESLQRHWVPWTWCETKKVCSHNNSIVIFKPSNRTLHAVRLRYDHLNFQRTQIYGNLMYRQNPKYRKISYKELIK